MRNSTATKLVVAGLMWIGSSVAFAASFEVKSDGAAERGWSEKTTCESKAGASCTSAYFCSNDIWMTETAFDRVQQRRYAGEQLIIVKDAQPICAVN